MRSCGRSCFSPAPLWALQNLALRAINTSSPEAAWQVLSLLAALTCLLVFTFVGILALLALAVARRDALMQEKVDVYRRIRLLNDMSAIDRPL